MLMWLQFLILIQAVAKDGLKSTYIFLHGGALVPYRIMTSSQFLDKDNPISWPHLVLACHISISFPVTIKILILNINLIYIF